MDAICLAVTIIRLTDDAFPGFVECLLVDADGNAHAFVEKVPVVFGAGGWPDDVYPRPGWIRCTVMRRFGDEHGRAIVEVSTVIPDGVESLAGQHRFLVLAEQLGKPG